ncbi:protein translocase subunit SecD [Aminobacter sp. AP02]|uniref:protein translocase subunit SecD n=1 Tax=Aminobacter sp. AP02 TaxID=2135737 RepID=UPI000D6C75B1|nr:protein translocase subunit SecD [Aminobacter sp. AP02]PWK76888.1 protein translocase subunit secF /protein translocase subunit secD [Aminobacter sp. AP02]
MRTSRWVVVTYTIIILAGIIAALPNVLTAKQLAALPSWFPKQQVTLGLDLQGGSHLVLEVDAAALKTDRLRSLLDDVRGALRKERINAQSARLAGDAIVVSIADDAQRATALSTLQALAVPVTGLGLGAGKPDIEVTTADKQIKVTLTEAGQRDKLDAALQQSLEIVRQRVDQVGVAEPTIQRVGSDRMLVQLPGLQDPTRLRELLGSTAKMTFHMVANVANGEPLPRGVTMLPDAKSGRQYPVEDRVALDGARLTDARAGFDQRTQEPLVSFRFDSVGARQFAEITAANVGKPFAIVLDGKVLSAPSIREPITGGSGQISGSFSVEETVTLSALLRAGALPAPLTVIEERTVGPDLGGDVIKMGIYTGIVGFVAVVLFMVALYGTWGMIANFALLLHLILTFGVLTLIGGTLTLPGIAGIILGIGFGVDANILINERIREESKKGLSAFAALDNGFKRAYSTIVDANVTSLIATGLLFMFGSGPVRGFAITMFLGTCLSMFTAVSVTRILMAAVVRRKRLKTITIEPLIRFFPEKTSISFMKARYLGIGMSIFLSLASIGLFFKPGLNYGIDFKGGIQVEIATSTPADLAQLRSTLGSLNIGEVALQQIGSDGNVLIRVQRQEGGETAQTAAVDTIKAAVQKLDPSVKFERTEVVGPKVSGELAQSGIMAVVLAALAMLVYIWWRFEWNFAIGAIATLVLDTTKMVGFFALFGLDFNLTAIAALLTIIGYSVNDKVVVYDRMRENLRLYKKMPLREIIDMSINQVFARCIYTSVAILLSMLPMAIWGGSAVENFAVPMVFGVFIATTSSIFIAAPILLLLGDWWQHRHAGREPSTAVAATKA